MTASPASQISAPPKEESCERTDLPIEGMTCASCASRIQGSLEAIPGVKDANVNFATGTATVKHEGVADSAMQEAVEGLGYAVGDPDDDVDADAEWEKRVWQRFLVAVILGTPVLLVSMIPALEFPGWEWVALVLTTPVVFWSGYDFHRATIMNLRHGAATMDTLVSMGTVAAWTWSTVVLVLGIDTHVYFESAAVIIALILLGKYFESRASRRAGDALRAMADLGAPTAMLEDGTEVPAESLQVGDRFLVRPGEKVATDGTVVSGRSAIDASLVTGEPMPVSVETGDEVIGATLNVDGSIVVAATRVGSDTTLAQVAKLVEDAQGSKAGVQRLADRVAGWFVPVVIVISLGTLAIWILLGYPISSGFTASVSVLIIACPCALGLATPMGIMVGTGRGAQLGVIIRGGEVLEDTRSIDTVVLDKTGTITEGKMSVADVITDGDQSALLAAAAALERRSEHPIARAVATKFADDSEGGSADVESFENYPGLGVGGVVGTQPVKVGRAQLFEHMTPAVEAAAAAQTAGHTVVFVGESDTAQALILISDTIKPSSAEAIRAFTDLGLNSVLLTGDAKSAAEEVAAVVGITDVTAEVLPDGKLQVIESLQSDGARVAMVGDGINDAPALAQADLGIAVGTGTDVAREASDLTVVSGDLLGVADAIALARRTLGIIKGNLFWAFAYNVVALPLAAFGVLNPMIASAAMGFSSVFVVTNSLRLRSFKGYRAPKSKT